MCASKDLLKADTRSRDCQVEEKAGGMKRKADDDSLDAPLPLKKKDFYEPRTSRRKTLAEEYSAKVTRRGKKHYPEIPYVLKVEFEEDNLTWEMLNAAPDKTLEILQVFDFEVSIRPRNPPLIQMLKLPDLSKKGECSKSLPEQIMQEAVALQNINEFEKKLVQQLDPIFLASKTFEKLVTEFKNLIHAMGLIPEEGEKDPWDWEFGSFTLHVFTYLQEISVVDDPTAEGEGVRKRIRIKTVGTSSLQVLVEPLEEDGDPAGIPEIKEQIKSKFQDVIMPAVPLNIISEVDQVIYESCNEEEESE